MVLARQEAKEREEKQGDISGGGGSGDRKDNNESSKGNPKSTFGDASIVQNIHFLYVRAKRKWKEDLSWHLQHAEFAKEVKSYQMLSRIYAEALQIHPRNENLWIEAASHEYFGYEMDNTNNDGDENSEGGGSIKSARVLLQRGLRINPTAKSLWLQSFCLELHYIQKLRGRREILQLQAVADRDSSNEDENDQEVDNTMKLPVIIFKNAIKAIPDDVVFRLKFVEQCKLFPQTQSLSDMIMDSIETEFQNVEDVWIARAQLMLQNNQSELVETQEIATRKRKRDDDTFDRDAKVLQILREATDALSTPKMYLQCLEFLRLYFSTMCTSFDEGNDITLAKKRMSNIIEFSVQLINKAETAVSMSPELAISMASCLEEFGLSNQALKLIKSLTNDNPECKKESKCWLKIAEICESVNINDSCDKNLKASCKVLRKALDWVPLHDSGHVLILSKLFMNLLSDHNLSSSKDELLSTYEKILLLHHQVKESEISLPSITRAYIAYIRFAANDINVIRQIYKKSLLNPHYREIASVHDNDPDIMKEIFDECILVETEQLRIAEFGSTKRKQEIHHLLSLNDAAYLYFLQVNSKLAQVYSQQKIELSDQL